MIEIYRAEIIDPPISITFANKKKEDVKHYLTANIFYGGVKPYIRSQIVHKIKEYLQPYFINCPLLNNPPYSIVIQYCAPKYIDLDDRDFFWRKIMQDMLLEPTKRDEPTSIKLGKIKDDSSKYFDCGGFEFYLTDQLQTNFIILKQD